MVFKTDNKLIDTTIGGMLRDSAEKYPNACAIVADGFSITYSQLDARVDILARRFIGMGIKKGDHIGVICKASPELIMMIYALARIGAVVCLLNTGLKMPELNDLLISGDIRFLCVGEGLRNISYEDLEGSGYDVYSLPLRLCRVRVLDEYFPASADKLRKMEAAAAPQDTAMILYTSGSTGPAKPVMISHYSRVNCSSMQAKDLGATSRDVFLCALPMYHCFSLSANVFAACAVGACVCIPGSHHTADLLAAVQTWHCTVFNAVPAIFHTMIKRPDLKEWDLSSVRTGIIGGSMYSKQLFIETEQAFGMTLMSSLGQTEATGGVTVSDLNDPLELRASTVGRFMDYVEGRIVSLDTGEPLPEGSPGEICIRGYNVMQGYYNMPEETARVIDKDGWLHTGDMGYLDENGCLHMAGRIKDLIIRGGENISPIEIESVLINDPRISCCKAMAVPDEHYGEEICLFVELEKNVYMTEDEVRGTIGSALSDYKVPRYVVFIDRIPRTPTGKILTNELKYHMPYTSGDL